MAGYSDVYGDVYTISFPRVRTYVAWGYGPFDPAPVWTLIPDGLVESVSVTTSGRALDIDQFQGGSGTVRFNNKDGRFTPGNAASPYFPNVKLGTPIKFEVELEGTTYTIWRGFIDETPITFPEPPNVSMAEWPLVDAFAILAGRKGGHPWNLTVRRAQPRGWWNFEEPVGSTTAVDDSGHGWSGTYQGSPTLRLVISQSWGVDFDGSTSYVTLPVGAGPSGTQDFAIETVISASSGITSPIWFQGNSVTTGWFSLQVSPSGVARAEFADDVGVTGLNSVSTVTGIAHLIFKRIGDRLELWVNGVLDAFATGTIVRSVPAVAPEIGRNQMTGPMTYSTAGMDAVAVYDTSAIDAAAHGAAWANGTMRSGASINMLLDVAGWPTADRSIDTGNSYVLPQYTGNRLLDMLRLVSDSELGALYVLPDGRIRFRERQAILLAPYVTSQGTFGNGPGAHGVVIRTLKLEYARSRIRNDVAINLNWGDHPFQATSTFALESHQLDETSVDTYGPNDFTRSVLSVGSTLLLTTASMQLALDDLANWILAHYSEPVREIRTLTLQPHEGSSLQFWRHALERKQEDRITHTHTAPGGAVITGDYHIQRISHDIGPGKQWQTVWSVSPADAQAYWVWDTSTWDTSTRWAA